LYSSGIPVELLALTYVRRVVASRYLGSEKLENTPSKQLEVVKVRELPFLSMLLLDPRSGQMELKIWSEGMDEAIGRFIARLSPELS